MNRIITSNVPVVLAKKRLKITTVSRDTGISRTTLTKLYYDKNARISINVLERLCAYLDCAIGDILTTESKEA